MKTLIQINTNVSLYIFEDNTPVDIGAVVTVGDPAELIITDCHNGNVFMDTEVTPPQDWIGGKYCFDGENWTLNPDYVPPTPPQE